MGLDFSHSDAQWSYGGFNRFRSRLAAEIRVVLDNMQGFGGNVPWASVKDDIVPLLNHSDCDGHLTPEECAKVAPRLRELVANWPDDYDKRKAIELAGGMDECVRDGVNLEFC